MTVSKVRSIILNTNEPFKVENYYFQVLIQKLIRKTAVSNSECTYLFTTVKGTYAPTKTIKSFKHQNQS
jgi:hypothetical protein